MTLDSSWGEGRFRRSERTTWRLAPDRVVLCTVDGGASFDLLGVAAMVWAALDQARSMAELVRELAEFGADAASVGVALDDLTARQLIVPATSAQ